MGRSVLPNREWSARLADVDALEHAGVENDLRAVARKNAAAAAPVVVRRKWATRVLRIVLVVVVLAAALWVAGNAFSYRSSASAERPVTGSHLQTTVELEGGASERVDCWYTDSIERVREAAAPFDSVIPYRCGEGLVSAFVPGPFSAVAAGIALVGSTVLLVGAVRRRRSNWY
jgi:hypothetical protein